MAGAVPSRLARREPLTVGAAGVRVQREVSHSGDPQYVDFGIPRWIAKEEKGEEAASSLLSGRRGRQWPTRGCS